MTEQQNHLHLSFSGTVGENGYNYTIRNSHYLAVEIENYSVAVVGYTGEPPVYTMRTMTDSSELPLEDEYPELELTELLGSVTDDITAIEAGGSEDFVLYVETEEEETVHEALDTPLEIVLQRDGVQVDSDSLPSN